MKNAYARIAAAFAAALPFVSNPAALRAAAPDTAPPVTVTETADTIVLDNGTVIVDVNKPKATITAIKYRHDGTVTELANTMYYSYSASARTPTPVANAGAVRQPSTPSPVQVVQKGPDAAEIVIKNGPYPNYPFHTETHYVMPRGQSGFYAYQIYSRTPDLPAAFLGEARFVIKERPGGGVFTNHVVDAERMAPLDMSPQVKQVQDATFLLEDGTIYTKYDNSAFMGDHFVHGMTGHGLGLWMVNASNEYITGGPLKQELTVHQGNTLLEMLQGAHFGSGVQEFVQGEPWSKMYGPFLVYVNHGADAKAMYEDAVKKQKSERRDWPYPWVRNAAYPTQRGSVKGKVRLDGGSAAGAWAVLADKGGDWPMQGKGYEFWTKVDKSGDFAIPDVRPGTYALYFVGGDQFEQYEKDGVVVGQSGATDLGTLEWKPITHGKTLWQIGVADRGTTEFFDGNNVRHYGNFLRYPKAFPHDVTYTVGKSDPAKDWNFAQWTWYNEKPFWAIDFSAAPGDTSGKATLTFGVAASNPAKGGSSNVRVSVNGTEVGTLHLEKSGAAAYRSGGQDSLYRVVALTFDARLLRSGANEIRLAHVDAEPYPKPGAPMGAVGVVMYDAIRLEIEK